MTVDLSGLQTRCQLEYFKFPYDVQYCTIDVGSWQNNNKRIDFDSDDADINTAFTLTNNIFQLDSAQVLSANAKYRFPSTENATDIIYQFRLSRRPKAVVIDNILPTFILSSVTLLAFYFPFTSQIGICKLFL